MRAYRVAYDGRPFSGFQRQPDVPTVEGTLLDALERLDAAGGDSRVPDGYAAAGRTDAGVSAVAQTVAFDAPAWLSPAAFNSELPGSVRVWASAAADAGFHATHDAAERGYTYHLHAPQSAVDDERARRALDALRGEHDFHNLTSDETGTVRDLDGSLARDGEFLVVELRAGGFCRQLVRRVVGLVAEIARGDAPPEKVDEVLGADPVTGPDGVAPAPAYPLVLTDVRYPSVSFERDPDAVASAREVFEDLWVERESRARAARTVRVGLD